MKFECFFKLMKKNRKLVKYAEEQLESLNYFDGSIEKVHLTMTERRYLTQAEFIVWFEGRPIKALGIGETVHIALDVAFAKLSRQMARIHSRETARRRPLHSRQAKLLRLRNDLEFSHNYTPHRKQAKAA